MPCWLELALAQREYERVDQLADATQARIRQLEYRVYSPEVLFRRGQALLALNRVAEASTSLQEARTAAEAIGMRWLLWKILAALAEVEAAPGNDDAAANLRHEARTYLDFIIEHIPTDELRASFVRLPDVQQLLS